MLFQASFWNDICNIYNGIYLSKKTMAYYYETLGNYKTFGTDIATNYNVTNALTRVIPDSSE